MNLISVIEYHGYAVVGGGMFLTAAGIPLPASVLLLLAGAAADPNPANHLVLHHGLQLWLLLPLAWLATVAGDTLLYVGGRYTGWWLLTGISRLSMDPENLIFRAADYFYRRGEKTLLFARFVPGLANMAAPMAGSLGMRPARFLRLEAMGALGYVSTWMLTGLIFSRYVDDVVRWVQRVGHAVLVVLAVLVAMYALMFVISLVQARKYRKVRRVTAESLRERLESADPNRVVLIADVRSHGYYDPGMQRIKDSIRVEPHRLKEEIVALKAFMAPECEIYLYCTCIRDTTSARVAHLLEQENCRTTVIEGGLKAWVKAGGQVEQVPAGDVEKLPRFE